MQLEKKRALITGAGAGIGKAIAIRFAREGAAVVVSDIQADAGQAVADSILKSGGKAHFVRADMTRESDVERMIDEGTGKLGGLDVLERVELRERPRARARQRRSLGLILLSRHPPFCIKKIAPPHRRGCAAASPSR